MMSAPGFRVRAARRAFCVDPNSAASSLPAAANANVFRLTQPSSGDARRTRDVLPSKGFSASSTATHVAPDGTTPTSSDVRGTSARARAPLACFTTTALGAL